MKIYKTYHFSARLEVIGINPFVFLTDSVLKAILLQSGKEKSPIPVKGTVNEKPYQQTLVKYSGAWRLYINTKMLKNSPQRIGETISVSIAFDPSSRRIKPHPKFIAALTQHSGAKKKYESLPPYLQQEIVRYIAQLKTEESIDKNVERAVKFLLGEGSFIGREKI